MKEKIIVLATSVGLAEVLHQGSPHTHSEHYEGPNIRAESLVKQSAASSSFKEAETFSDLYYRVYT